MEKELQAYREHLEELVKERTANLEEANAALRVMLRKENEIKKELEKKVIINVNELILPALKKIKNGGNGKYYLDFVESNLNNILSSFAHKLSSKYYNLTPTQLQIANLIKHGKTTKEIAELLNLSSNTIHFHRANIRKKVRISKNKINLRSFLLSLDDSFP
jgi:DNA-binding NarL/FixJ family response regulator